MADMTLAQALEKTETATLVVTDRRKRDSASAPREGGIVIYSTDDLLEEAVGDLVDAAPLLAAEIRRRDGEDAALRVKLEQAEATIEAMRQTEAGELRAAITRADAAEALAGELEQECERRAKETGLWKRDRDRLQRVVDNLSHLHLCADHHPDKWESDGTCPLCEGERLKRVVDEVRTRHLEPWIVSNDHEREDGLVPTFINPHTVITWLDALLREGK